MEFYELQLLLLGTFCIVSLILERRVSSKKSSTKSHEHLENGKVGSTPGSLSTLARQYLVVYAIVMGVS
jgi:MFS transporter, MFS domain-containing protein family, molybdate-anion transporter